MSTTDTIRAAFEATVCEIVPRPLFLLDEDGSYQEIMIRGFWKLWNAAIAHASNTPKEVSGQGCALCGSGIGHDLECKNHPVNAATEAAKATGTALQPMTMSYVQNVPDQCDRITWRGAYYHLKEGAEAARQPAPALSQAKIHDITIQEACKIGGGLVDEIPADDLTALGRAIAERILAATNRSQP